MNGQRSGRYRHAISIMHVIKISCYHMRGFKWACLDEITSGKNSDNNKVKVVLKEMKRVIDKLRCRQKNKRSVQELQREVRYNECIFS